MRYKHLDFQTELYGCFSGRKDSFLIQNNTLSIANFFEGFDSPIFVFFDFSNLKEFISQIPLKRLLLPVEM